MCVVRDMGGAMGWRPKRGEGGARRGDGGSPVLLEPPGKDQ